MGEPVKLRWEEFTAQIAAAAHVPAAKLSPNTRLIADLNLDSLALAEVVALLTVELEMRKLETELATREWERLTLGALFDEYQSGEQPPRGKEYVVRERRSR